MFEKQSYELPKIGSAEQRVRKALESGDIDFIMYSLRYINHQLTGVEEGDFAQTYDERMPDEKYPSLREKVEKFVHNQSNLKHLHLYLGDGGGSRLVATMTNGKIEMVDVSQGSSSEKVKSKWLEIK